MQMTTFQKTVLASVCVLLALVGFMIKLPRPFRGIDREMHAAFYFGAAAFFNLLFARTSFWRHVLIFMLLFIFGTAIEYAQEYSNRFFRVRIHGRFDPEDVKWNLKGLVAFSVVWVLGTLVYQVARRADADTEAGKKP